MINHDTAIRAMLRLTDEITANYFSESPAEMLSSAELCLEDAESCYDKDDFRHCIERAEKGLKYLIPFYDIKKDIQVHCDKALNAC